MTTSNQPEDLPPQQTVPPSAQAAQPAKSLLREVLETIGLALVIFLTVRVFVMNYRVVGHSMVPTIQEGQFLLIDKIGYTLFERPQRGDIIVFNPPNMAGQIYIKRVIGLPGEVVELRDGRVFINGEPLAEEWQTIPAPAARWGPAQVGKDEVFVLGDNRPGSLDSRYFGMLSRDRIIGRALLCYWPPSAWTIYPRYGQ